MSDEIKPALTPEQRAALTEVLNALRVEGPQPAYHRAMRARLARDWPTLHDALAGLEQAFPVLLPPQDPADAADRLGRRMGV